MLSLTTALLLSLAPGEPLEPEVLYLDDTPNGLTVIFNYYNNKDPLCVTDPLGSCIATLCSLYYPKGAGPTFLGYPQLERDQRLPVFISLHGGGTAAANTVPLNAESFFRENVTNYPVPCTEGFLGVETNYPPVDATHDYKTPGEGAAYLIQWLRVHAARFNLDPDAICLWGRSYGGLVTYTTGLKVDTQDLGSPDVVAHEVSRPNVILPFGAPSDLTCFSELYVPGNAVALSFPVALAPGATEEEKLADSAVYWITHAEELGREFTPHIGAGYKLNSATACGVIDDPHDAGFGLATLDAIHQTGDLELIEGSVLWNTETEIQLWADDINFEIVLEWCLRQVGPNKLCVDLKPKPKKF